MNKKIIVGVIIAFVILVIIGVSTSDKTDQQDCYKDIVTCSDSQLDQYSNQVELESSYYIN
jgi:hypothetical protein